MAGIRIGEVARRLGVTTRTLRYYEEMGLLAPEARSEGGFRSYGDFEIRRLERITELKNLLGFNLGEIKEILTAEDELATLREEYFADPDDSAQRTRILDRALELNGRLQALVDAKMSGLEQMRTHLTERARAYKKAKRAMKVGAEA